MDVTLNRAINDLQGTFARLSAHGDSVNPPNGIPAHRRNGQFPDQARPKAVNEHGPPPERLRDKPCRFFKNQNASSLIHLLIFLFTSDVRSVL